MHNEYNTVILWVIKIISKISSINNLFLKVIGTIDMKKKLDGAIPHMINDPKEDKIDTATNNSDIDWKRCVDT